MPPEPTVLAFDTSAAHCAAALLSGNNKLAERFEVQARGQAERLFPMLEEMLDEAGLSWSDLNVIGVGVGPGNFTGIRISVAAARGLALSLGIPAVGVSVLEAQAEGLDGVVLSSLDGRRGQMYLQVFGDTQGSAPVLCDFDTLPPLPARAEPWVVGHAADRLAGACAGRVTEPPFQIAEAIARIATRRRGSSVLRPAPLYIRSADAAPPSDPPPVILP